MSVLAHKVVRDLSRRRLRTGLTILGIAIGVAGLVAVSTTARGLAESQRRLVSSSDYPDLTVRTGSLAPGFAPLVARALDGATVDVRTVRELAFSAGGPWRGCTLIGPSEPPLLARPILVSGTWPGPGEIAFDAGVDALADVAIGDLVAVRDDGGPEIVYLRVAGFTRTPGTFAAGILNRAIAYADASVVERLRGRAGPNELLVKLAPGTDVDLAAASLDRLLSRREIPHLEIERGDRDVAGSRELRTVVWLLLAFSVLGVALSGVLVANTVAAIVLDETRQIGALKALGASRWRVATVYGSLALTLGVIGTLVGYALGLVGGRAIVTYLTEVIGYPRPSDAPALREVGLAAAVGLATPLLASVGPVALAARRPPAVLLRTYGLTAGTATRTRWRRSGGGWPMIAIAVRNAARRRLRAGFTVCLIAVAVAAAIASRALSGSLDGTVATLYERYGADVWIAVSADAGEHVDRAVAGEPGVLAAETWSRRTGFANQREIDLWGVPATTSIYDARPVDGRWLRPGERRAGVASSALARRLKLSVGDTLRVDLNAETVPFAIVGIVDDESTYLGSTAAGKLFVLPETLASRTIGGFAVLAVRLHRHDPASVEAAIDTLEQRLAPFAPSLYATYGDQESTERTIAVLTVLLRAMVALVGLTGLVGVVNTLTMNLAERRREIGVMRALGARRGHLALMTAGEGAVLGAYGYAFGVIIGLPTAHVLVDVTGRLLFGLQFHLTPAYLGLALATTLVACATAAIGPALVAGNVRPYEVLRYE